MITNISPFAETFAILSLAAVGFLIFVFIVVNHFRIPTPEPTNPNPNNCQNCKFINKENDKCTIGSVYAEKGLFRHCSFGERWEPITPENNPI